MSSFPRAHFGTYGALTVALAALLLSCAQTRAVDPEGEGFLTQSQWALMAPGTGEHDFELMYTNPRVDWSDYHGIMIDSVAFWRSTAEERISGEDQQMILDYFYAALHREIGERTHLVDAPGPGIARLQIAITGAQGAKVAGRVATTVVPQLRIVTTAGGMASDASVTVGEAGIEAKLTDSLGGRLLGAAADRRIGQKSFKGMTDKWSDMKQAIDIWSEKFAENISQRIGTSGRS